MRALSFRSAANCETACKPRCKCRCHGELHGVARGGPAADLEGETYDRGWFERLPPDDPHHVRSEEERKEMARVARERRRGQLRLPIFDPIVLKGE